MHTREIHKRFDVLKQAEFERSLPYFQSALFDLDGVLLDTESQYSLFWDGIGREYRPDVPNLGDCIKGQTLTQIYQRWFEGQESLQEQITARLNAYEQQMQYPYIAGALEFVQALRQEGKQIAIVTSSNIPKMQQVYRSHPELTTLFDHILTSEDFNASKPDPHCYLLAAERCHAKPEACVVFEDSINGLKAGRASGAFVVGLATTNPAETISPLADLVINDFTCLKLRL